MKSNTVVLAALAAAILLTPASCKLFDDINELFDKDFLGPLGENQFYAQHMVTREPYKLTAKKLWEGDTCTIWAEEGSEVTYADAEKFADEYDTKIRTKLIDEFSVIDGEQGFADILAYADSLADSNGKLTILFLDIQDGYDGSAYVAGYFFAADFYRQGKIPGYKSYSNGRDMIYVDTNPGLKNEKETYANFAHELQHLINYATRVRNGAGQMDTWVNEGLSAWAEYLYYEVNPPGKCNDFINDVAGTIAQGNNFFVWGNHQGDSILDEYSTVYLFFRWLYLQAKREGKESGIFKKIIDSPSNNYQAVTEVAKDIDGNWENWETLLGTWLAANYYPSNPFYGYIGDNELMNYIKVKPISESSISLYPGEGVYSVIRNSFTPQTGGGSNIRYRGLVDDSSIITASPITGNILLTFNANTSNGKSVMPETGYLTGISDSSPARAAAIGNSQAGRFTGPYVLDARDLMGRDWEQEFP